MYVKIGIKMKGIKMKKIVINAAYGGFRLGSRELTYLGMPFEWEWKRDDPKLVKMVETGEFNEDLKIVEIPDDVDWIIQEYDGFEWVAENHRTWG
jgi:hypothetical protein